MKKIFKITIILIMVITIFAPMTHVYASKESYLEEKEPEVQQSSEEPEKQQSSTDKKTSGFDTVFSDADKFLNKGKKGQNEFNTTEFKTNIDAIYNILVIIGTVLAVIIGGVLGIKFMLASAEDKAKIKEALIPYIVGCVVIFGAFRIWAIVVKIFD